MNTNNIINSNEYNFLRSNKNLKDLAILAFGGSIAYGTNTETSDVDIRGIALNPIGQLLGMDEDFEQVVNTETDTVIYSLRKIATLLTNCNPNTIEILGCKPEHYIFISDKGQVLLNNKKVFLSKKAIGSFGGYAKQQLYRLEHGLLGNGRNSDKEIDIMKASLENSLSSFNDKHKNSELGLALRVIDKEKEVQLWDKFKHTNKAEELGKDLLVTGEFRDYPVSDFKTILSEFHNIQSTYGNMNHRNNKKTGAKLAKHQMHLIRLYLMGIDLNERAEIVTYRDKEHDMLMDIRNMKYMYDDGLRVRPEFYDLLNEIQSKWDYSCKHTVLPDTPDVEAINQLIININKER